MIERLFAKRAAARRIELKKRSYSFFSNMRKNEEETVFRIDFPGFRDTVKECQFNISNTGSHAE